MGVLSLFQFHQVATNTTNVESLEKDRVRSYARRYKYPFRFPYDKGWLFNAKSVLGPNPWRWLWPTVAVSPQDYRSIENDQWPPTWYLELDAHRNRYHSDDDHDSGSEVKDIRANDVDDSSDTEQGDELVIIDRPGDGKRLKNHVRRGSEGYEVRQLTPQDRERMLNEAMGKLSK